MRLSVFACLLLVGAHSARSDTIECVNGDRYNGKVLQVDGTSVKFQSEISGLTTLDRGKVVTIHFTPNAGPSSLTQAPAATHTPIGAAVPNADAKAVEQVQNEFLAGATPEAQAMFKNMAQGLMSGALNLQDVRSQAQGALTQLKDLQKDLDDDDSTPILGSYISILENFLKQSANAPLTPPPAATKKPD